MILLVLALIFGAVVAIFLIASMIWAKRRGKSSKLLLVLKLIVLLETVAFLILFVVVLLKTMAM